MGFRSNFITEDMHYEVPQWFCDKYPDHWIWRNHEGKAFTPIAQPYESKFYNSLNDTEIFQDIQKVLVEQKELNGDSDPGLVLILIHECGGITRVTITPTSISGREPVGWKDVESVGHDYCYGCSSKEGH